MSWETVLELQELEPMGPWLGGLGALAAVAALVLGGLVALGRLRAFPAGAALLALGWLPLVLADWQGAVAALAVAEEDLRPEALYGGVLALTAQARAVAHAGAILPTLVACLLLGVGLARLPRFQPPA